MSIQKLDSGTQVGVKVGSQILPNSGAILGVKMSQKNRRTGKFRNKGFDTWSNIHKLRNRILEALDPTKAGSKVRTLADMTEEEKETIRKRYEK